MSDDLATRQCQLCHAKSGYVGPEERDAWKNRHDEECESPLRKLPKDELLRLLNPASVRLG